MSKIFNDLGFKKRDGVISAPSTEKVNGMTITDIESEILGVIESTLIEDIDGQAVITSFNIEHDIFGDGSSLATYPLNSDANDLSGNYNGTATNVTYSDGKLEQGAVFDGSSSKIDLPLNTVSYPFSVSSWIKPNDWNTDGQMIVSLNTGERFSIMIHSWGGNGNLMIAQGGQPHFKCDIGTSSDFVNVVVVANGVNDYNVFVDGVEVDLVNVGGEHGGSGSNCIGSNGSAEFFNGEIDQVRVLNKVLNESDISKLYNEKASVVLTQEDGQPNWRKYQVTAINPVGDLYINGLIQELESTLTETQYIVQIASGYYHTMVLLNDGTVKGVGRNNYGQLGIGYATTQQLSWVTSNITDVKSIGCGGWHTMVLLNDGTVKAVGRNDFGEMGIGNRKNQPSWVTSNITDVKSIHCGYSDTLVILNDGTVKASGLNREGQLGNGDKEQQLSWVTSNITDVKSIVCGKKHTVAILNDGTVKAVGGNEFGQLGIGDTSHRKTSWVTSNITNVKSIACGEYHTMAVLNDGTVKAVGENMHGQLGTGNTTRQYSWVTSDITNVKSIVCGSNYTMAILNDGTVKAVGFNFYGQLGIGNTTTQTSWATTDITNVKSISGGLIHTVALLNDGTVKSVGGNAYGQLGNGVNGFRQIYWEVSTVPIGLITTNTYAPQTVNTNTLEVSTNGSVSNIKIDLLVWGV